MSFSPSAAPAGAAMTMSFLATATNATNAAHGW
jgi:hypothetical protein